MERARELPLDWLDPALAECRRIIERGVHQVWEKSGSTGHRETVTDLDLHIERTLVFAVRNHIPTASIFTEETQHDSRVLNESETCFVIDPIEGTDEMMAGRSGFAISVAQFRRGQPVAGILDFPRQGRRFAGAAGKGTWHDRRRVHLRPAESPIGARIAVSASQRQTPRLAPVWHSLRDADLVTTPGFAPKLAAILAGECGAAIHLPVDGGQTFLWDYAAAALLLEEAGGVLVTWAGQDLLRSRPLLHTGGWIAAASHRLQAQLRAAVQLSLSGLSEGRR